MSSFNAQHTVNYNISDKLPIRIYENNYYEYLTRQLDDVRTLDGRLPRARRIGTDKIFEVEGILYSEEDLLKDRELFRLHEIEEDEREFNIKPVCWDCGCIHDECNCEVR